jgi:hypothetical protein
MIANKAKDFIKTFSSLAVRIPSALTTRKSGM